MTAHLADVTATDGQPLAMACMHGHTLDMHADSIHGSIERRITDFPSGFEGQWVARMGVLMTHEHSNTVRCLGLSPTFATLGGS